MLYNLLEKKNPLYTAGKVTIATALAGLLVFAFVFLFNAGKTELMRVEAQTATTTLTVLNTPPVWVASSTELIESSVTNPTNSGSVVSWVAVATDPNQANYYLLICAATNAPSSTNGGAPRCNGGTQWGVSAPTPVGTQATVSTTTSEIAPFAQSNNWYAWICDDDAVNARCNASFTNGTNATNTSPFVVNFRPTFSAFGNNSPTDPGGVVTFSSTSSDPDGNNISLIVCNTNSYSTTTNTCNGITLASTTGSTTSNATALYQLLSVIRDANYDAFGFLFDQFGHEASGGAQGTNSQFTVNNVAPTVGTSTISINGGLDISLTQGGQQTTGITLAFETTDANSCRTITDTLEVVNYRASLYHTPTYSSSTCSGFTAGHYNPNYCYTSAVATTTWNISCTASSTSCALGGGDATMNWSCTFPLWHITNPTDSGSFYELDQWRAAVAGIDDDNATGTQSESGNSVDVDSFPFFDLLDPAIPYGQLEPGQNSGTLNASTTIESLGNTGLNQLLTGEDMCTTFSVATECRPSATSTIPAAEQEFGTSTIAYGTGQDLSSTSPQLLQLRIPKSTSTSTPETREIYWGINVPGALTLAGSYTGLNTFQLAVSASSTW